MTTTSSETKIKEVAYGLWEQEGCPEGRDKEHYFRALKLVENRSAASAAASTAGTSKPSTARRTRRPATASTMSAKPAATKSKARKTSAE